MYRYIASTFFCVAVYATSAYAQTENTQEEKSPPVTSAVRPSASFVSPSVAEGNKIILDMQQAVKDGNATYKHRYSSNNPKPEDLPEERPALPASIESLKSYNNRPMQFGAGAEQIPQKVQTPTKEAPEPITDLTPSMRKHEDSVISAQLIDGQQVVFRPNGYVSIIDERGRATTPPDGILTLKDGTTFNVKEGLRTE